jgi:ribosomal protein S17E
LNSINKKTTPVKKLKKQLKKKFPEEQEVLGLIKHLLLTENLYEITKKTIREKLSLEFQVDFNEQKQYISELINQVIIAVNPEI